MNVTDKNKTILRADPGGPKARRVVIWKQEGLLWGREGGDTHTVGTEWVMMVMKSATASYPDVNEQDTDPLRIDCSHGMDIITDTFFYS